MESIINSYIKNAWTISIKYDVQKNLDVLIKIQVIKQLNYISYVIKIDYKLVKYLWILPLKKTGKWYSLIFRKNYTRLYNFKMSW